MVKRTDPGLLLTARTLPMAIMIGIRLKPDQRRRCKRMLEGAARGKPYEDEQLFDELVEGTQGLGGIAIAAGLCTAAFLWMAKHFMPTLFSALAIAGIGALVFASTLGAIYGMRATWTVFIGDHPPRRLDFWVSLAFGVMAAVFVYCGLFIVNPIN